MELEPWDETAHRQLMCSLAAAGQRSAALAQYETCRRVLGQELGVEPGKETTRLYQQIRDGSLVKRAGEREGPEAAPASEQAVPHFLEEGPSQLEAPVFVAREPELMRLHGFLEEALGDRGRVAFVTGEAGTGETALLQELARGEERLHDELIVATENCSAYTGIGDPYFPFRQIVGLLTGDVAAGRAAGVITEKRARRLWRILPLTVEAMVDCGLDLIDTFVLRGALLERATMHGRLGHRLPAAPADGAPPGHTARLAGARSLTHRHEEWLNRLVDLLEQSQATPGPAGPRQLGLFDQYSRVVRAVGRQVPLVLILDDLQWADAGSINLLFHLVRELAGGWYLGFICFGLGEPATARTHLERVISFYDPGEHHHLFVSMRGSDPGVSALAYDACCLWCLGYPERSARRSSEALALGHALAHPFSLADVVCFGGCILNQMRRNVAALREDAEELMRLSKGMGFSSFLGWAICLWGEALTESGRVAEGMEQIRKGMQARQ